MEAMQRHLTTVCQWGKDSVLAAFGTVARVKRTLSRKFRMHVRPWLLFALLVSSLPVLYVTGFVSVWWIIIGAVGPETGEPDRQGLLGIGFAAAVPVVLVGRVVWRIMDRWYVNRRLWVRNKHHELLDDWF